MGGEVCYQVGRERGPWYEITCVRDIIVSKEARGEDASFERKLLKSWAKYPGWQDAGKPFGTREISKSGHLSKQVNSKPLGGIK